MKHWLLVLFLCFSVLVPSQTVNHSAKEKYYYPKVERTISTIPPGTIKLKDNLYIDKFPVNNMMYQEMLNSVLNFWNFKVHDTIKKLQTYGVNKSTAKIKFENIPLDKSLYATLLTPDEKNLAAKTISSIEYLHHPRFSKFPVLNFNIYQAVMFCKWRTDMVKLFWATNSTSFEERKKLPLNFEYRLATKEEIEEAKEKFGISDKPIVFEFKNNKFIKYQNSTSENENRAVFIENRFEELTLEAYLDTLSEKTNTTENLTKPLDKTVFRCVCEIKN